MTTQAAVFSAEEVGAILSSPSYVRNIFLVCTGNTCRSPMAAALLKQALASRQVCDVNVESAGLWVVPGSTVTPNSVKALAARGIDISKHVPRMLDAVKVKSAELILTMTRSQKETIVSMFPDAAGKVFTMSEYAYGAAGSAEDVRDPYGGPLGVYEETANQLAKLADLIAARFKQQRGNGGVRVVIGNDHAGIALVKAVTGVLNELGIEWEHIGTFTSDSVDYPDYGEQVATQVAAGKYDRGILICGTGIGMCIVANKVPGIRAALCSEPYSAALSRLHNDANVLCLGARVLGPGLAEEIVRVWMTTDFAGERHSRRVNKINALDARRSMK